MSASLAEIKRSLTMLDGEDATIGALIATGRLRHAPGLAESDGTPPVGHPMHARVDGYVHVRVTLEGLEEFHVVDGEDYPAQPAISHTWAEVGTFLLQGVSPAHRAVVTAAYDTWFHLHAKVYVPLSNEWAAAFVSGTQTSELRARLNTAHRDVWDVYNGELVPAVKGAVAAVDVPTEQGQVTHLSRLPARPARATAVRSAIRTSIEGAALRDVLAGLQAVGR